jgi:hypothetical protein
MKIELEVSQIQVVTGNGTDKVLIHTSLPEGTYPYTGKAYMMLEVEKGSGAAYVLGHFEMKPEVINIR